MSHTPSFSSQKSSKSQEPVSARSFISNDKPSSFSPELKRAESKKSVEILEIRRKKFEDYKTKATSLVSGDLKKAEKPELIKKPGKDYRTTSIDTGELKKSDRPEDKKRLEAYRAMIGSDKRGKKEKDEIKQLKAALERERKLLEEKKKQELEKRKRQILDRESEEKMKISLARDKLKLELEKRKKNRLKENKKKEEERRKEILQKKGLMRKEGVNCWEYMKCNQERFCPAYPNRGMKCAHVVGNLEGRKARGPLALQKDCSACKYYKSKHYEKSEE